MGFFHGSDSRFYYFNNDLSPYLTSVDPTFEREYEEIRLLDSEGVHQVGGLQNISFTISGVYDSGDILAADLWAAFERTSDEPFAYLPGGDGTANDCYIGEMLYSSNGFTTGDEVIKISANSLGSGDVDRGEVMFPLASVITGGNSTFIDFGSAVTLRGYGACLIAPSNAGTVSATTWNIDIWHSTTPTFSGAQTLLASFTTISAAQTSWGEFIESSTATVLQYCRVYWTKVGVNLPRLQFFCGLAQRPK
jgi:hypothetical protein